MNQRKNAAVSPISRREFARRAAVVSAASLLPATALVATPAASAAAQQPPPNTPAPQPSSGAQAEIEARLQSILGQYASRFSDEQKTDLRRLCALAQPPLDRLRAFNAENGQGNALYLKPLIEHERKPSTTPAHSPAASAHPAMPAAKKTGGA